MKRLLLIILILLLLAAALLWFLAANAGRLALRFRPTLERLATEAVGAPVTFEGISVSIFPAARIALKTIRVGGDRHAASASEIRLTPRLLPLLGRKLQIVELEVVAPRLTIVRSQQGVRIEGLGAGSTPDGARARPGAAARAERETDDGERLSLDLQTLRVTGAGLTFRDQQANFETAISDLDMRGAVRYAADTFLVRELEARGQLPKSTLTAAVDDLDYHLTRGELKFAKASLTLGENRVAAAGGFSGAGKTWELTSEIDFSQVQLLVPFVRPYVRAIQQYRPAGAVSGTLAFKGMPGGVRVEGPLELENFTAVVNERAVQVVRAALQVALAPETAALSTENASVTVAESRFRVSAVIDLLSRAARGRLSSDQVDLAVIADFLPQAAQYNISGRAAPDFTFALNPRKQLELEGSLELQDAALNAGKYRITGLSAPLKLARRGDMTEIAGDSVRLTVNGASIESRLTVLASPAELNVTRLDASAFGGTLRADGSAALQGARAFSLRAKLNDIGIEPLLAALAGAGEGSLSGTIDSFQSEISGDMEGDPLASLRGPATLRIREAELRNVNLPRLVLEKLDTIPFLAGTVYRAIPPESRRYFESESTPLRNLEAETTLAGRAVQARRFSGVSELFAIEGSGSVTFDSVLDLDTTIIFNPDFSRSLAERSPQLRQLLNRDGMLVVPLKIDGRAPKLRVLPDVGNIAQQQAERIIERKAGEVLEGLLRRHRRR